MIAKSPIFVQFGANLTHFGAMSEICAVNVMQMRQVNEAEAWRSGPFIYCRLRDEITIGPQAEKQINMTIVAGE